MPWTANDAKRHTKHADTPHLRRLWARVANNALKEYGNDEQAIRTADAAVNNAKTKKQKSTKIIRDLQDVADRF